MSHASFVGVEKASLVGCQNTSVDGMLAIKSIVGTGLSWNLAVRATNSKD